MKRVKRTKVKVAVAGVGSHGMVETHTTEEEPDRDVESEELLDWDSAIATAPRLASTTIYASVRYRGRPKLKLIEDPWD